ncbi:MAG: InlB B-repeat-containing protein [Paludibacteraceae bacterium]|nr:InlB B-repeat-containing protein [Paludibacteraceae bacterium]
MRTRLFKSFLVLSLLILGIGNTWGLGTTYYSALKAQVSSGSPSGSGKVYAGTSNTAGTYVEGTSTSSSQSSSTENDAKTFYAFAQANEGYSFTGWSTSNGGSIVSTDNPYQVTVKCSSSSSSSPTTTTVYANFVQNQAISVTFIPATNGSYTVKGTKITSSQSITCEGATNLVATPASGYKFFGWYTSTDGGTTKNYFAHSASVSYTFLEAATVYAEFIPSSVATFMVKGTSNYYYDFAKGLTAASSSSSKVLVVASDGSVLAGDYTIPSGVTLLVPFDAAYTLYTTAPTWPNAAPSGQSAFRKLTLSSGANIVVNGAISVSAQSQGNQPYGGCVYGKYGQIDMAEGSAITIKNGANLYCWGYITGKGSITAKSGASVYEDFQLTCWRGGTAATTMNSGAQTYGVFPLAQYYIQNIEAPLTLEAGSHEYTCTAVTALRMVWDATVEIVGTNSGLFRISSGNVTKWYDSANDKQMYSINGVTALGAVVVDVSVTISSANFVLPLTNNMDITVASGTLTCDQRVAMLPGSRITINEGAKVQLSNNGKIYVYDKDEWKGEYNGSMVSYNYSGNVTHTPAPYSPSCSSIKTLRTFANMNDAEIDINGTFEASGALYTTKGGANIKSSQGTGTIIYKSKAGTETKTYQAFQGGSGGTEVTWHEIPITSAQLHNSAAFKTTYGADFEYLATAGAAANTTITYKNGHWGWLGIWKDYNGNTIKTANTCLESQLTSTTAPSYTSSYSDGCFEYTGTSTTATSTWTAKKDAAKQEIVYTPVYASAAKTYTVTYLAGANGTGSVEAGTKTCGEDLVLSAATFTRAGYLQTGWSTADGGAKAYELGGNYTADAAITLYPFWTMNTFTIIWKNEDGSIMLQTDANQNAGTPTAFNGDTPNKDATAQYTYTFDGWAVEANGAKVYNDGETPAVSADATYYAHFSAATNTYTVTWKNVNNVILETDENVPYGTMPTYDGETPAHPDYVDNIRWDRPFEGWTPAIGNVTGNVEYTAVYGSETAKTYTIIWQDYDGTELARTTANYGWDWPEYPGVTPQRSDAKVNYTFIGWTEPATSLVAGNAIFTAVYRGDIEVAENEQKIITENTVVTTATIRALGRIEVANAAKLSTENLIIEATPNKSGEVVVSGDMEVTGEAYFDFEVNSDDWHWNAFGVPFEIDLTEHAPLLERITPMTLGYDYDIVYYNANTRAEQGPSDRCWDYVEQHGKKLIPGKMYLIVFNHHLPHVDVIRFTKASGKPVDYTEEVPLTVTGTGINDNWNGISNPKMYHALLDAGVTECQVHDGGAIGEDAYIMHNMNNKKFFVGKAAFVQSPASQSVVIATPATTQLPIVAQAPRRAAAEAAIDHYDVQIASEYSDLDDRIYVLTAEEKEDKYVIVADLAKAGVSKARAQMWVNRYGTKLCKNTTELVDYQANYPLGIFAPAEGNYDLFIDEQPNDGSMLYLTLDGEAIWNLSYGGYTVRLEEGTTNRYGLRVVAKAPQITTPIEEVTIENGETIRKIISGDMIYIIRNGETYTITGQKTK